MTEYLDRYPTMHEYAEGKRINPKLTDLISRADAIEAVRSYFKDRMGKSKCDYDEELQVYVISKEERTMLTYNKGINDKLRSLPSAELPKGDLISRADVLKYPIRLDHYDEVNGNRVFVYGVESVIEYVESLPSADAVSRDVYEKRTKADEEIIDSYRQEFQKTLSADAVQGEWIRKVKEYNDCDGHRFVYWYECSVCGARPPKDTFKNEWHSDYCPSCGAIMKGGAE